MNALALIPAYNEAAHIAAVVAGAAAHLPVLVVDDGSADDTVRLAEKAGATVVRHAANRGKGTALVTGFGWAVERGSSAVVTLDADGQHDPAEIPAFLDAFERGAGDLIIGRRRFDQMPRARQWANATGSRLLSWAVGQRIHDNQSGYRLVSRRALETFRFTTTGFDLEVEMIAQAARAGLRIGWVPIRTIYAGEQSHINPLADTARFLRVVWRARRAARG
jgi:glycosyltransferase involved in cell wall biosynthesis